MTTLYKFVCIYRKVDQEETLEEFFSGTHLPLAEQLDGLVKSEVSRIHGKPGGESRFHMMYELYFDSREAYVSAMSTEVGILLMQQLKPWGDAKIITWFYAESMAE